MILLCSSEARNLCTYEAKTNFIGSWWRASDNLPLWHKAPGMLCYCSPNTRTALLL